MLLKPDTYVKYLETLVLSLLAERPIEKGIVSIDDHSTTFSPYCVIEEIAAQKDAVKPTAKKYVLVYTLTMQHQYYKGCNSYLGDAILTNDIDKAHYMPLSEAISTLAQIHNKKDWEIYSVKTAVVLDAQYHIHELLTEKERLEKELARVNRELHNATNND